MSEQLATQLQEDGDTTSTVSSARQEPQTLTAAAAAATAGISEDDMAAILAAVGVEEGETVNDEMIARMLQLQFDREHNTMLDREQNKYNGTSKVTISFQKYKTTHPAYDDEEEEEEDEDDDFPPPKTTWEESTLKIGGKGYTGTGKNITTKHDRVICGRRNAERLMEFPPEFESGDGEGMDMQLPNKVYNKLKMHSITEMRRGARHTEKKLHSTAEKAVDENTRIMLYKMLNSGLLESIGGAIAGGKESVVFHAHGGSCEDKEVPKEVAIKVFKTSLMDFRTREKYVHGDHRFSHDDYKKQNPRKIIKMWAMKEVANLNRMRKFSVPCPTVVTLKKHVLVMTLIGGDKPAPKLKDTSLSTVDLQDAYEQTLEIMKCLHHKCCLVHADLSEFNLLWHAGKVWVIDVSQAVDLTHPEAFHFLYRDCCNISTYFKKQGVHAVLSPEKLFNEVTGLDIQGKGTDFCNQVQRYDKEKKESHMLLGTEYTHYAFDYFFDLSQQQKAEAAAALVGESDEDSEDEEVEDESEEKTQ